MHLIHTMLAAAGEVDTSSALQVLVVCIIQMFGSGALWVRLEHRLTKIETKMESCVCGSAKKY